MLWFLLIAGNQTPSLCYTNEVPPASNSYQYFTETVSSRSDDPKPVKMVYGLTLVNLTTQNGGLH